MRIFLFLTMLLPAITMAQQSRTTLDSGNVRAAVNNNGSLFNNGLSPAYEVPKNSGVFSILTSGLWIGGTDASGNVYAAAATYDSAGFDFWPGPLDTTNAAADDTSYWNHVWKVNRKSIEDHKSLYNNAGYQVPWDIQYWPGNNKRPLPFAPVLGPFVDLDNDLKYEPEIGETPFIEGTEAAYFIWNDNYQAHHSSKAPAMGIEVHGTVYSTNATPLLENTVFLKLRIVNRSSVSYDSVYLGMFTDFQLGNRFDNYVATDPGRNMYYCYNGENYDTSGYLDNPPAQAVVFLGSTLSKTISFGWDTSVTGWPEAPDHFYNYLAGRWKDNSPLTDQLNGYGVGNPADHVFSGDPCTGNGWTEIGELFLPGKRSMLGSIGPFSFSKGQVLRLDLAYVFSSANSSTSGSVCKLKQDVDAVTNYWKNNLHTSPAVSPAEVKVYPNPFSGLFHIDLSALGDRIDQVQVFSAEGRDIYTAYGPFDDTFTVSLADRPAGVYYLKIAGRNGVYSQKMLKK